MPQIDRICVSKAKGERKRPVECAELQADHGLVGDAHAGPWHRQVSLLAAEDIAHVRARLPDLQAGDFAENIIISGLPMEDIGLGSRLRLGSTAELTISQIGKSCHAPCQIYHLTGDCIMPRLGLFARVTAGGPLHPGDPVELVDPVGRQTLQCVVLTLSDRCSQGQAEDTAGPAVVRLLQESLKAHLYRHEILPDDHQQIRARLMHYSDGHSIDLIVTVGGTGFSPRDVAPEATREVVQRLTPGLDEAMRVASMARTPHAMLSRSVSGIRGSTLIINLPGSLRASRENLHVILPALGHGLAKLRGDQSDCGRPITGRPDAGDAAPLEGE